MELTLRQILERLVRLEALLEKQVMHKAYFTPAELAKRWEKSEFRIQQRCREGTLRAVKSKGFSGPYAKWVISYEEVIRFEREGPYRGNEPPDASGCPAWPKKPPKAPPTAQISIESLTAS